MTQTDIHVVALLGTDHHPFDRLVQWLEEMELPGDAQVLVQRGYTRVPADHRHTYVEFLPYSELTALLRRATAVVTHGGPGTIVDCRQAGLVPVVVPRSNKQGEHVDDHQQLYTARMANDGLIIRATTRSEFEHRLVEALDRPREDLQTLDARSVADAVDKLARLVRRATTRRI